MTTITIQAEHGLHARPLAEFVKMAAAYTEEITLSKGAKSANAKSLIKMMSLGVKKGEEITLNVEGNPEAEAILADFLVKMV